MLDLTKARQRLLRWKFRQLVRCLPAPLYGVSEIRYLAGLLVDGPIFWNLEQAMSDELRTESGEVVEKGGLTVAEAGRRGGKRCKEMHGQVHYQEIGKKGGSTTKARYGADYYAEIGKKGGTSTSATHGPDFYQKIGKRGGDRVRQLIERGKALESGE